jgi:hypothetical protein
VSEEGVVEWYEKSKMTTPSLSLWSTHFPRLTKEKERTRKDHTIAQLSMVIHAHSFYFIATK